MLAAHINVAFTLAGIACLLVLLAARGRLRSRVEDLVLLDGTLLILAGMVSNKAVWGVARTLEAGGVRGAYRFVVDQGPAVALLMVISILGIGIAMSAAFQHRHRGVFLLLYAVALVGFTAAAVRLV